MNYKTTTLTLLVMSALVSGTASAHNHQPLNGSLNNAFSSWGSPSVTGDWQIVEKDGNYFIELGDNFKAKKGPDVKIFLSPTAADDVTGDNAVNGSVFVTQISNFEGGARFAIPSGTDISRFESLVFHCEAFSKLWGTSALR
ncbi:MAG: DM13 domain-containing protein [Pseudomonadota bacterium]